MKISRARALAGIIAVAVVIASGQFLQNDGPAARQDAHIAQVPAVTAPDDIQSVSADLDRLPDGTLILPMPEAPQMPQAALPDARAAATPHQPKATEPLRMAATSGLSTAPGDPATEAQDGAGEAASAPQKACGVPSLSLQAQPGAMIGVVLVAPCNPNAAVVLRYAGVAVDLKLPEDGVLSLRLPALAAEGELRFELSGAPLARAAVPQMDMKGLRRVALASPDAAQMGLNAYEHDAAWGGDGHVTRAAPSHPGVEGHGYLTFVGLADQPGARALEVYTAPEDDSTVRLELDAAVDRDSCGHDLAGELLRSADGSLRDSGVVVMSMPDCRDRSASAGEAANDGDAGFVVLPLGQISAHNIALAN